VEALKKSFELIDTDKSGQITANELTGLNIGGQKFSIETTLKLVKVFDADNSGNIGFYEYAALHKFVSSMRQAYLAFDLDKSGLLDYNETQKALQQGGFFPSPSTFNKVFFRFANKAATPAQQGIDFNGFVLLCSFLGQTRTLFTMADFDRDGWIHINLDQFMDLASNF